MPKVLQVGAYSVYFQANEGTPLEPVHVHVKEGVPNNNATKIQIAQNGSCVLCHNNSQIPRKDFKKVINAIQEDNCRAVIKLQKDKFHSIQFHC